MFRLCIGLLTHCDDVKTPERFEVLKKSINSLERLKSDDVYIYLWDNCSSEGVRNFLDKKNFFNAKYYSNNNLYDVVAVHKLAKTAEEIGADYVCHLEDDFFFYESDFVKSCCDFLDINEDCGYLRILKYDYHRKYIFDKLDQYELEDKLASLPTEEFNKINENDLKYPWSYRNAKKSRKTN